jgi:hypothetical protein
MDHVVFPAPLTLSKLYFRHLDQSLIQLACKNPSTMIPNSGCIVVLKIEVMNISMPGSDDRDLHVQI